MKLAFISEYEEIGGGESNLMNLCAELSASHEVVLFCNGMLYEQATARGIHCRKYALGGRRWVRFVPLISFPRDLRRELANFDLVHAYSLNILPRLFMLGKPVVWTTHGYWERPKGIRARIIDLVVERVVAVSTDVYNIAQFSLSKKCRIFLGTALSLRDPVIKHFDTLDVRIACIGRFQEIKGQDLLLEALGACARAQTARKFTLELIGDVNGFNAADLQFKVKLQAIAKAVSAPNLTITFKGFHPNPTQFMQSADFVVIPSRYESFSMVTIEALACGKPVIVPDIGGPKDIVNDAAIGLRFAPGDAAALSTAVQAVADNFSSYKREACVRRAQDFSISRQAHEHLVIYKEIVSA